MTTNEISGQVVDAAMKVHTALGPGLLEGAYEACLAHELRKRGFQIEQQKKMSIEYDGELIDAGYRLDLLINNEVVVELKAVASVLPIHHAQIISYLKLGRKPVGLLINFHVERLKDGIKRFVN